MPALPLGGAANATSSNFPAPADINRRIYFGNGNIRSKVVVSSPAVMRRVFLPQIGLGINSKLQGGLAKRVLLPGTIQSSTSGNVKVFVSTTPVPVPVGKISVPTLDSLLDPKATQPNFNGSRISKGSLFPVSFKIAGQQLSGLNAYFIAQLLDKSQVFEKSSDSVPGGILLSDPALDAATKVETRTGSFQIGEADLATLTEETELKYTFFFADQLGRKYIIESGSFFVTIS